MVSPPATPPSHRILLIDSLRGLLAWTVVFCHIWFVLCHERYDGWFFSHILNGEQAVCCFFAISGFSVVWSALGEGDGFSVKSFLVRRWWRIYPVYVLALLAMYCGGIWMGDSLPEGWLALERGGYQLPQAGWHWLTHLFMLQGTISNHLLPGNGESILSAAWSLSHEEQFYLSMSFPLLLFARRKGVACLVAGGLIFGLMWACRKSDLFGAGSSNWTVSRGFWFGYYEYFLLGISCALMIHPAVGMRWKQVSGLVYVGALFLTYNLRSLEAATLVWVIAFGLVCLRNGSMSDRLRLLWALLEHPAMVWLGRCSYSTYLFHWVFLVLAAFLYQTSGLHWSHTGQLGWLIVLGAGLTLAFSSACYWFIERPLIHHGRKMANRWRRPPTALPLQP